MLPPGMVLPDLGPGPCRALFVKGLAKVATERHLHSVFAQFGPVVDCQVGAVWTWAVRAGSGQVLCVGRVLLRLRRGGESALEGSRQRDRGVWPPSRSPAPVAVC